MTTFSAQPPQVEVEADSPSPEEREYVSRVGSTYTKNMWYFAMPAHQLKRGKMISKKMLGQPILIGRDQSGAVFAIKDICPHQGIPLSTGHFDGKEVECCFHGWRFDTAGICTAIPSLLEDQDINICNIKTQNYPCREEQNSIWVFIGDRNTNLPNVPQAPGLEGYKYDKTTTTLGVPTHIDYAVVALIDTAHVPYVHKSWWWRSRRHMFKKEKHYVPSDTGWTMVRHKPSKHSIVFKLIGNFIETEIGFRLPGCRIEHIIVGGKTVLSGITTLTPIDETTTELNHTTYWTIPFIAPFIRPFVDYFVYTFLNQDKEIADMQQVGLAYKPNLVMTVKDAGTPGAWYFQLKREWNESQAQNRPFKNPIKEKVLRWRT